MLWLRLKQLKWRDAIVRQRAAQKLGESKDARAVEPLLAVINDEDNLVRKEAIIALGKIGDTRGVGPLVRALGDYHDPMIREVAVEALGKIGDKRAVEQLVAVLKDNNSSLRKTAISALGEIGDKRAIEPLVGALKDWVYPVRKAAAESLSILGWQPADEAQRAWLSVVQEEWDEAVSLKAAAVEPLVVALRDRDCNCQWEVAEALGKVGDERGVESLAAALSDGWCTFAREAVVEALNKIGDKRAVKPLVAVLKDKDASLRKAAAEALNILGWKPADENESILFRVAQGEWDAARPLLDMLTREDVSARITAAKMLGELGDARAMEPLLAALKDQSDLVRSAAISALGSVGDSRAIWVLEAVAGISRRDLEAVVGISRHDLSSAQGTNPLIQSGDKDEGMQVLAWLALAQLGCPKVRNFSLQLLVSPDASEKRVGAWMLGQCRYSEDPSFPTRQQAVDYLLSSFEKAHDPSVRAAIAGALGRIGDQRAVEPFIVALKDKDSTGRKAVAEALGKIGSRRAVELLVTALRDEDSDVQEAAAGALANLGWYPTDDTQRALLAAAQCRRDTMAALKDADPRARAEAARALGKIGDMAAIESLAYLLFKDTNTLVMHGAVEALGEISSTLGDSRAIFLLFFAGGWGPREDVREAAMKELNKLSDDRPVDLKAAEEWFETRIAVPMGWPDAMRTLRARRSETGHARAFMGKYGKEKGETMITCDLCSETVSFGEKRYSAPQVQMAVRAGLRPTGASNLMASLMGMPQGDAHAGWVQMVMRDTTDWAVCPACASRIEQYLNQARSAGAGL